MYQRLREHWLAAILVAFAIVLAALGSLHAASGESCVQSDATRVCEANPSSDTRQPPTRGAIAVFAPPPAPSQNGLLPLRLALLSGTGLPQSTQPETVHVAVNAAAPGLHWPASGLVTQLFGVPELGVGGPHTGLDIGVDAGNPVRAGQAGRVTFAGGDPCCGLGYWVEVNHGDHYSTRYGHLMRPPIVLPGDFVTQGQTLGFSGNTGFSTGPHVHFEVRFDGIPVDPLRLIPVR
jgi:murein DD-endopeptidase MepM/ murein hydrolase activator NlpD